MPLVVRNQKVGARYFAMDKGLWQTTLRRRQQLGLQTLVVPRCPFCRISLGVDTNIGYFLGACKVKHIRPDCSNIEGGEGCKPQFHCSGGHRCGVHASC